MTGNTDENCYARASCAGNEMSEMESAMVLFIRCRRCILSIKKKFQNHREVHFRHLVTGASLDGLDLDLKINSMENQSFGDAA